MNRRRGTILGISAALAVGLLTAPLLLAGGGGSTCPLGMGGHSGHGGFGQMGRLIRELDLTGEQKEALHRVHATTREKNAQARAVLHDGFVEAAKILIADPQNVAGARAAITKREATIDELKENVLAGVSQCLSALTPAQRAKLTTHLEQHAKELSR